MIDGPGDYDSAVYLPDSMARDAKVYPASHYAPIIELPDPADMYDHLFPQDT